MGDRFDSAVPYTGSADIAAGQAQGGIEAGVNNFDGIFKGRVMRPFFMPVIIIYGSIKARIQMSKAILFITGMSGTGKSTVLEKLSGRGYKTIDTDYDRLSIQSYNHDMQEHEWVWDEFKMKRILEEHAAGVLFISGTVSNQGKFYPYFDEIICLSAPADILMERVRNRTTNDYGKTDADRKEIMDNLERFGAIIEAGAGRRIDATRDIDSIADEIESLARDLLK